MCACGQTLILMRCLLSHATITTYSALLSISLADTATASRNVGPIPAFGSLLRMKARGGIKGMRPWYKRWFVIDDRGVTWYADEAAAASGDKVGGRVPMHDLIRAEALAVKGETRFVLHQKMPRGALSTTVHLSAESAALMHRWLELIGRHLDEQRDELAQAFGTDSSAQPQALMPQAKSIPTGRYRAAGAGAGHLRAAGANAEATASEGPSADGTFIGEQVERRLQVVIGNDVCADCVTSNPAAYPALPTWGSTNIGVVFCIRCSGVHRKLGAHITKVLSLQIDSWTPEQLEVMEGLGNARVNAELEHTLPAGYAKPDQATCTPEDLERHIRSKYELRSFVAGGDGQLADVTAGLKTKAMDEFCGLLIIRLIRASDLARSDHFVEFSLGDRKAKSKTVKGSSEPSWNAIMTVNVRALTETLSVKLYDAGSFGGASLVGQAMVPMDDLTHDGQPIGFQLDLSDKNGASLASTVAVELTYNPLTG